MKNRHELLLGAIGVFEEEEQAYHVATQFSWILPTAILCGGILDLLLIVIYMKFTHPWKDILSEGKTLNSNEGPKEVSQVDDEIMISNAENYDLEAKVEMDDEKQEHKKSSLDRIRYVPK